jgi:hypothetical protein
MDPERIHAYLQAACAGLGFDIGEVWFSSMKEETSSVTSFGEYFQLVSGIASYKYAVPYKQRQKSWRYYSLW